MSKLDDILEKQIPKDADNYPKQQIKDLMLEMIGEMTDDYSSDQEFWEENGKNKLIGELRKKVEEL